MKQVLIIFLISSFFLGCETVVDIELEPHESLISVFCMAGNGGQDTKVCIGYSKGINEEGSPGFLADADILIEKNNTPLTTIFNFYSEDGCYTEMNDLELNEVGSIYKLTIDHPSYPIVSASQTMPDIPSINEVNYEVVDGYDPLKENHYNRMDVRFTDNASTEDYYHIQGFIRNICCEEDFYSIWTWSDNLLLGETVSSQGLIFNDEIYNGTEISLNLKLDNTYIEEQNHYLYLRLSKITRDRYLHLKSKKAYADAEGNFFAEPVTIHSNIEGGYGIFGLEAVNMYRVD